MASYEEVTYPPEVIEAGAKYLRGALLTPQSSAEEIVDIVLGGLEEEGFLRYDR